MRPVGIAATIVVAGVAVSTATAAPLTEGTWLYGSNYGGKPRPGNFHQMRVYVEVTPAQATILSLSGNTRAKCSKGPKRRMQIEYTAKKPQIAIVGNSSFSSKWIKLASYSGFSGRIKLKGSIDTNRVKGTLWLRSKGRIFGNCSVKEKFTVKIQATSAPS